MAIIICAEKGRVTDGKVKHVVGNEKKNELCKIKPHKRHERERGYTNANLCASDTIFKLGRKNSQDQKGGERVRRKGRKSSRAITNRERPVAKESGERTVETRKIKCTETRVYRRFKHLKRTVKTFQIVHRVSPAPVSTPSAE